MSNATMSPPRKPRIRKPPPPPTPKAPKPWDAPPRPINGDADNNVTFASVGRALSCWEYFEGYLGLIYGLCVGAPVDTYPAMRAYGVISAFSNRLDLIRAAAESYYFHAKKSMPDELSSILDDSKNFSTRRNEIAHGIVQPYHVGLSPSGFALGPSRYSTRKLKLQKLEANPVPSLVSMYAYTSVEIDYFASQFTALADRLIRIWPEILRANR
jgi:hypothetical protein